MGKFIPATRGGSAVSARWNGSLETRGTEMEWKAIAAPDTRGNMVLNKEMTAEVRKK